MRGEFWACRSRWWARDGANDFGVDTPQTAIKIDGAAVSIPNPRTAMQLGVATCLKIANNTGLVLEYTDNIPYLIWMNIRRLAG
ncbi:MAG: hypothetical protein M9928_17790 [Anaerolineae bacterium]|nr:hypothetical protein [Anaerolineae bacterium]